MDIPRFLPQRAICHGLARVAALLLLSVTPFAAAAAGPDPSRVAVIAERLPVDPGGLGPRCAERDAWSSPTVQERLKPVLRNAENLLGKPFPAWSDEAYLEFSRRGERTAGERMMNARMHWLSQLTLAECAEYRGRFLGRLEEALDELSRQPAWTWPAHDARLETFRDSAPRVDLVAADLAHDLAHTLYLLGDRLAPAVRERVMQALERRVFAPMRADIPRASQHWWLTVDHNWNAVCIKGVVGAALAVLPDRRDRALFAAAGEHYIRHFVGGFPDDGYSPEGAGYWGYGVGHFVHLRELLWRASNGAIELFADPRVRDIALYGPRFEMLPGNLAWFGDTAVNTKLDEFTLAYVNEAMALGLPVTLRSMAISTNPPGNSSPVAESALKLFERPAPAPVSAHADPANGVGLRSFFPQAGVLVARPAPGSPPLAVTIKAGGNANHSHNDIGSYSIAVGKEQPVGDPGRQAHYNRDSFGAKRYQFRLNNSWGHPVPAINDALQTDAAKVRPRVLATRFAAEEEHIEIDLSGAYNVAGIESLTRALTYQRRDRPEIRVEDRFRFDRPRRFESAIITRGTWKQLALDTLEFARGDARLIAQIEASSAWELVTEKADEDPNTFTRIAVRLRDASPAGWVRLRYSLP